jgi:RND family efflux transporter MFP subunit
MRPMSRRAAAAAGAALAAAAVLFALFRWRGTAVEAWTVSRTTVRPVVAAAGEILPPESVRVFPRVIGRVEKVLVHPGDRVRPGDPILELDRAAYADEARKAQAAFERASGDAGRAAASVESAALESARSLARGKLASREYLAAARLDLRNAERAKEAASASLGAARTRLAGAREALARTRVEAPAAGEIAAIRARSGETVSENEPVAEIADPGALRAAVDVPASAAAVLATGAPARVTAGGVEAPGVIRGIAPSNKSGGSPYDTVMIALVSAPAALRPGMTARARLEGTPRAGVLAAPLGAIVRPADPGAEPSVWVISGGRAHRRTVAVASAGDRLVEIASGLREGETIAGGPAAAVRRLREGERVRVAGRVGE